MVTYKAGDILRENTDALVNTVNCVGVMGRGIALQFKKAFPGNFLAYAAACNKKEVQPAKMFVYETRSLTPPKFIINFPTKRHWKGKSRIEDIKAGLSDLTDVIQRLDIQSIAIPPLGAGLGGLNWDVVRPLIEDAMASIPHVQVTIFEPKGAPKASDMVKNGKAPHMTVARAVLVVLMERYLKGFFEPFITLIEVQKLLYFLQEAGQRLGFKYTKAAYGPYAETLRHVLNGVEGYFVSGYADGGDNPFKQLQLVPGAVPDAKNFLNNHSEINDRFEKVSILVDGFETTIGMELLATVHWVAIYESATSFDDVVAKVHGWNERKRVFTPRQIKIAYDRFIEQRWLQPFVG